MLLLLLLGLRVVLLLLGRLLLGLQPALLALGRQGRRASPLGLLAGRPPVAVAGAAAQMWAAAAVMGQRVRAVLQSLPATPAAAVQSWAAAAAVASGCLTLAGCHCLSLPPSHWKPPSVALVLASAAAESRHPPVRHLPGDCQRDPLCARHNLWVLLPPALPPPPLYRACAPTHPSALGGSPARCPAPRRPPCWQQSLQRLPLRQPAARGSPTLRHLLLPLW